MDNIDPLPSSKEKTCQLRDGGVENFVDSLAKADDGAIEGAPEAAGTKRLVLGGGFA